MENIKIFKIDKKNLFWDKLIIFAKKCSWNVGKHLAKMMINSDFSDWESVFIATSNEDIVGFCTFLKTDYYPDNRYSPWISSIFVNESHRGNKISEKMINHVICYAKQIGFTKVYISSDITGLYEKYGFLKIDELVNYSGDSDNIFMKII